MYETTLFILPLEDDDDNEEVDTGELRDQDRFLPIANVARIMKKAIPSQVTTYIE